MRILVADDHSLFREILREYLKKAEPECDVILVGSLGEAMDVLDKESDIDIVLLDVLMPGMNGLNGIEDVQTRYADTRIAIISGTIEPSQAHQAIKMGVVGYFPKTLSAMGFIHALKLVLSGETYLPTDISSPHGVMPSYRGNLDRAYDMKSYAVHEEGPEWRKGPANDQSEALSKLTRREKETLDLLMVGNTNKQIAQELDIKEVTVKLHVRSIYKKLGVKNRTEAALFANGLKS